MTDDEPTRPLTYRVSTVRGDVIRCPFCDSTLGVDRPSRLVHYADGSHMVEVIEDDAS